ncbi:uncharacterized protein [Amphiura filiformis]|uniref:uncharacterized protein n=1 Tax=Amphiura filiformis TaxID=82378 RepID=UPI003B2280BD
MSNGIIQIGWATKDCQYGPEKGVGIGDFINSCAYDGARCKKWNGPVTETLSNDYGMEWCEGDIVSCLMDCNGNASFWLHGVDMGVAFKGLDLSQGWHPACSVSSEQQLRFNFGDAPFRYGNQVPSGFVPFCQIRPPKITDKTSLEEQPCSENRNNNAEVMDTHLTSPNNEVQDGESVENQDESYDSKISAATCDTNQAIHPPVGFDSPIAVDDSTDEVCPVLSPDDDTSMAEFGYSGIQGEECADTGTAMEEPITDEFFGEGGEEALQPDMDDSEFQAMGAGDEETCDGNRPISRQLYLSSAGEAGGENPTPSLYYEVAVTHSSDKPLVLGYCTMDELDHVCAVLVKSDNQIVLPDEALTHIPVDKSVIIGCGLLSPPGAIFFTIDGNPIRHLFSFSEPEAGQTPLMPCTNNPFLRINYGQRTFAYEPANQSEHRLGMAALLHNYHQRRMVGLGQAR